MSVSEQEEARQLLKPGEEEQRRKERVESSNRYQVLSSCVSLFKSCAAARRIGYHNLESWIKPFNTGDLEKVFGRRNQRDGTNA